MKSRLYVVIALFCGCLQALDSYRSSPGASAGPSVGQIARQQQEARDRAARRPEYRDSPNVRAQEGTPPQTGSNRLPPRLTPGTPEWRATHPF